MKILVVEDRPTELKLIHQVLSATGFTVKAVQVAEEALFVLCTEKPDLVLVDMNLPGIDGLQLVQRIKEEPETRDILIVAITSSPEAYSKAACLAAGCDGYITKPIDTRTIASELEAIKRTLTPGSGG